MVRHSFDGTVHEQLPGRLDQLCKFSDTSRCGRCQFNRSTKDFVLAIQTRDFSGDLVSLLLQRADIADPKSHSPEEYGQVVRAMFEAMRAISYINKSFSPSHT